MIKSFAAVHLCYPATSVSYLMRWALQKQNAPTKKMLGTDPILFSDLLDGLFLLNGVLPPPILLGRRQRPPTQGRRSATNCSRLLLPDAGGCLQHLQLRSWNRQLVLVEVRWTVAGGACQPWKVYPQGLRTLSCCGNPGPLEHFRSPLGVPG